MARHMLICDNMVTHLQFGNSFLDFCQVVGMATDHIFPNYIIYMKHIQVSHITPTGSKTFLIGDWILFSSAQAMILKKKKLSLSLCSTEEDA